MYKIILRELKYCDKEGYIIKLEKIGEGLHLYEG